MRLPLNAVVALASAATWGAGDFSGGVGAKAAGGSTRSALRVIVLAHICSVFVLCLVLLLQHQTLPHGRLLWWSVGAGVSVGFALTAFYIALSRGGMGVSAAISGVLAAAIPAVVSSFVEGAPGIVRLLGFALTLVAIWVIAAGPSPEDAGGRGTIWLAVIAGVGFGVYFVALRMANPLGVVMPMAIARVADLSTCGLMLLGATLFGKTEGRGAWRMSGVAVAWALSSAVLDTSGNMLFVWATRLGRLDVAAVLGSLYPLGTILLAAWVLKERPTRRQVSGMVMALVAVVMITV